MLSELHSDRWVPVMVSVACNFLVQIKPHVLCGGFSISMYMLIVFTSRLQKSCRYQAVVVNLLLPLTDEQVAAIVGT